MSHRQLKTGYFALEAINSFAATFYLYYLFFLARHEFGFANRGNLFSQPFMGSFTCLLRGRADGLRSGSVTLPHCAWVMAEWRRGWQWVCWCRALPGR